MGRPEEPAARRTRAVALTLAALGLAACPSPRALDQDAPPNVTLHGVRMQSYEGDVRTTVATAEQVTYQRGSGEVTAVNAQVRLREGFHTSAAPSGRAAGSAGVQVEAAKVEGSLNHRQAEGSGGVVFRNGLLTGRTDRARFDGDTQEASGQSPIHLVGPRYRLDADSFQLKLPEQEFVFDGGVSGHLGGTSP